MGSQLKQIFNLLVLKKKFSKDDGVDAGREFIKLKNENAYLKSELHLHQM